MKSLNQLLFCLLLLLGTISGIAQTQRTMSYQGVLLNDEGKPIANEPVNVSIAFDGTSFSSSGSAVTSDLGAFVVHLALPSDTDFLQDANLTITTTIISSQGTLTNTSPLSFVPAAIYALKAKELEGFDTIDESNSNELQKLSKVGNKIILSDGGGEVTDEVNDADFDITNELQDLNIGSIDAGEFTLPTLTLSMSDQQILLRDINVQYLGVDKNTDELYLAGGIETSKVKLEDLIPTKIDTSNTNELQSLTKTENNGNVTLSLDKNNSSVSFSINDGDSSETNEIQTLTLTGDTLGLTQTSQKVILPKNIYTQGSGININNNVISAVDTSATNEIQTLTLTGDTLGLTQTSQKVILPKNIYTQGSGININNNVISAVDTSATNELQNLTLTGSNLMISGGNTISLSSLSSSQWTNVANNSINYSSSGNVGIGTDTPNYKLHVPGSASLASITFDGNGINSVPGVDLDINGSKFTNSASKDVYLKNGLQIGATDIAVDGMIQYSGKDLYFYRPSTFQVNTLPTSGNPQNWRRILTTYDNVIYGNGGAGNIPVFTNGTAIQGSNIFQNASGNLILKGKTEFGQLTNGAGYMYMRGDNNNLNVEISNWGNNANHGYINVRNQNGAESIRLYVNNNTDNGDILITGIASKPGSATWVVTSDKRLKNNIIPYKDGLSQLLKINPVKYHYNKLSGYDTTPEHIGVIAQDVQEIAPFMVSDIEISSENKISSDDGSNLRASRKSYLSVDPNAFTYMTINAIKEQQAIIDSQSQKIESLEASLKAMMQRIDALENK